MTIAMGTRKNTGPSAFAGVKSSLNTSFSMSAKGWNIPNGPHRLGPTRLWKRPMSRRSNQTNTAAPIRTALTRITMITNPATTWDSQDGAMWITRS